MRFGVWPPNSYSASARTSPGLRWVKPRSRQYAGNEASSSPIVRKQNSFSSGSPASSGCWPIMVTITELNERAGASTKSGANRARIAQPRGGSGARKANGSAAA